MGIVKNKEGSLLPKNLVTFPLSLYVNSFFPSPYFKKETAGPEQMASFVLFYIPGPSFSPILQSAALCHRCHVADIQYSSLLAFSTHFFFYSPIRTVFFFNNLILFSSINELCFSGKSWGILSWRRIGVNRGFPSKSTITWIFLGSEPLPINQTV